MPVLDEKAAEAVEALRSLDEALQGIAGELSAATSAERLEAVRDEALELAGEARAAANVLEAAKREDTIFVRAERALAAAGLPTGEVDEVVRAARLLADVDAAFALEARR